MKLCPFFTYKVRMCRHTCVCMIVTTYMYVSMFSLVTVFMCVYVCARVYVCVCVCTCLCVCVCTCVCCACVCACVHVHVCVCVCCVCVCVCVCVRVQHLPLASSPSDRLDFSTPFVGTLLHFDDHNLRDLYILDPQWLAKLMAHVIHPQAVRGNSPVVDGMCICLMYRLKN